MTVRLPSFDLVVATVGREDELARFLDSVEAQGYPALRVLLVDQNEDDRVGSVLDGRRLEVLHLRAPVGLSRARNVALEHLRSDLVAFPDDDCVYPPGLLARVGERFASDPGLAGLTGRAEDAAGASSPSWRRDPAVLTERNLWNRGVSFTIFVRRELVRAVGAFDERLGLGSGEPWSSGEEIDYLIRAVLNGSRIEYDPSLVVRHPYRPDTPALGFRDGASVGYLLRKHRYPPTMLARMLVRPVGGIAVSLGRLDVARAAYYAQTLRGRVRGYLSPRRSSNSSA